MASLQNPTDNVHLSSPIPMTASKKAESDLSMLLFSLGFILPFLFYLIIGFILLYLYPFFPLISIALVFILTLLASVSFVATPTAFPLPVYNLLYKKVEKNVILMVESSHTASENPESEKKLIKNRIMVGIFRDLGICNFIFCVLSIIVHFQVYHMYGSVTTVGRATGIKYTDVDPRNIAQSYSQGGRLTFKEGSRVDTVRIGSFSSVDEGKTYCAAPILYPEIGGGISKKVQYWAVGVDCCWNDVFWCDEAIQPKSKEGYVISPTFTSTSFIFPSSSRQRYFAYKNAIHNAKLKYNLKSVGSAGTESSDPILVRWTSNGDNIENDIASERKTALLQAGFVIFVLTLIASGFAMLKTSIDIRMCIDTESDGNKYKVDPVRNATQSGTSGNQNPNVRARTIERGVLY